MIRGIKKKRPSTCSEPATSLSDLTLRTRTVSRDSIQEQSESPSAHDSQSLTSISSAGSDKGHVSRRSTPRVFRKQKPEALRKTKKRISRTETKIKMDKKMINTIVLAPFHALKQCFQTKLKDLYLTHNAPRAQKKIAVPSQRKSSPVMEYNVIELRPVKKTVKREREETDYHSKPEYSSKLKRKKSDTSADDESTYCQCTTKATKSYGLARNTHQVPSSHRYHKKVSSSTLKNRVRSLKNEKKRIKFQREQPSRRHDKVYYSRTPAPSLHRISTKGESRPVASYFEGERLPIAITIDETDEGEEIVDRKWRANPNRSSETIPCRRDAYYKTRSVTRNESMIQRRINFALNESKAEHDPLTSKELRKRMEGSRENILVGTKSETTKDSDTRIKNFHDREPVSHSVPPPEKPQKEKSNKEDMILTGGVAMVPAVNKEPPEVVIKDRSMERIKSRESLYQEEAKEEAEKTYSSENVSQKGSSQPEGNQSVSDVSSEGRDETEERSRKSDRSAKKSTSKDSHRSFNFPLGPKSKSRSRSRSKSGSSSTIEDLQTLNIKVTVPGNSDGATITEVTKLFDCLLSNRSSCPEVGFPKPTDSWLDEASARMLEKDDEPSRVQIEPPLQESVPEILPSEPDITTVEVPEEEWRDIEPLVIIQEHPDKPSSVDLTCQGDVDQQSDDYPQTRERSVQVSVRSSSVDLRNQLDTSSQTSIVDCSYKPTPQEVSPSGRSLELKIIDKDNDSNELSTGGDANSNDKTPSYIFGPRNAFSRLRESCEFPFGISRIMSDDDDSDNGDYFEFHGNH